MKLRKLEQELGTRVLVEPQAALRLDDFSDAPLTQVLDVIEDWARGVDLKWIRVAAVPEPDDPDWEEVVVKIAIGADQGRALELWRVLGDRIDGAKALMDERTRKLFDHGFRVHILWGAWAEESWQVE